MKHFALDSALAALSLLLLQGCADIIDGSHQDIAVSTYPTQADCTFEREGGEMAGRVNATPGIATIKKTKQDLTVRCRKEGYQDITYLDKSSIDPWFWANFVIPGGIIGLGVDWGTGAWNEYKSDHVSLNLTPAAGAAPVAVPSSPAAETPPADTETPAITPSPSVNPSSNSGTGTPASPNAASAPASSPFGRPSTPLHAPSAAVAPNTISPTPLGTVSPPGAPSQTVPYSSGGGWGDLGNEPATRSWSH